MTKGQPKLALFLFCPWLLAQRLPRALSCSGKQGVL